jgi:hypothetical protein
MAFVAADVSRDFRDTSGIFLLVQLLAEPHAN